MNVAKIVQHIGTDLAEIVRKLAQGRFQAAWCAWRTHTANFRNILVAKLCASGAGGGGGFECPCCGWTGHRFRTVDAECLVLPDVECPRCITHERHRFLTLYLDQYPMPLPAGAVLLHIAPEALFHERFSRAPGVTVLSTDLFPDKLRRVGGKVFRADIESLALPDASVDAIICLHVLEHVVDDRRGIAEMFRVLRPGGWALIMIPLGMHLPETVEHPPGVPLLFGHLRDYSPLDATERLAPFEVATVRRGDFLSDAACKRFGVPEHEVLYLCHRV